jgi:hypothetical protein
MAFELTQIEHKIDNHPDGILPGMNVASEERFLSPLWQLLSRWVFVQLCSQSNGVPEKIVSFDARASVPPGGGIATAALHIFRALPDFAARPPTKFPQRSPGTSWYPIVDSNVT